MIILGIIIGLIFLLWLSFEWVTYVSWKSKEITKDFIDLQKKKQEFGKEIRKYIEGSWEYISDDKLFHSYGYEGGLYSEKDIELIFEKYLGIVSSHKNEYRQKVVIKARTGTILIERILENEENTDVK